MTPEKKKKMVKKVKVPSKFEQEPKTKSIAQSPKMFCNTSSIKLSDAFTTGSPNSALPGYQKISMNDFAVPKNKPPKAFVKTDAEEKKPQEDRVKPYNPEKEFLMKIKKLTRRYSSWEVWHDFIVITACSISNSVDFDNHDERKQRYLHTINKYSSEEQKIFSDLFALVVLTADNNPEQDFLGKLYIDLDINNKERAQFFTPYHICELMAAVTMEDIVECVKAKGTVTINDPCCGSGSMLIAGINEARRQLEAENIDYKNHVLATGQDIDEVVALMCYIQLSLLDVAGYVKVGNSITDPIHNGDSTEKYWFTPMYFSNVWFLRRLLQKYDPANTENE